MEVSYSSFRLKAETDSLMLGRWEKWKSRRSCEISKRSGKVLPLDFSAERLFPRPFYPRIVLKTPKSVLAVVVVQDAKQWNSYNVKPLTFVHSTRSPLYTGMEEVVAVNLDYIISTQKSDGGW